MEAPRQNNFSEGDIELGWKWSGRWPYLRHGGCVTKTDILRIFSRGSGICLDLREWLDFLLFFFLYILTFSILARLYSSRIRMKLGSEKMNGLNFCRRINYRLEKWGLEDEIQFPPPDLIYFFTAAAVAHLLEDAISELFDWNPFRSPSIE